MQLAKSVGVPAAMQIPAESMICCMVEYRLVAALILSAGISA